jgi:hypothetical protein
MGEKAKAPTPLHCFRAYKILKKMNNFCLKGLTTSGHANASSDTFKLVKILDYDDQRGDVSAACRNAADDAISYHHEVN